MSEQSENTVVVSFRIEGLDRTLHLVGMRGTEEISTLFRFELEVTCGGEALDLRDTLARGAVVTLRGLQSVRHFHGMISAIRRVASGDRYHLYRLTLVPRAWRLSRGQDCRIFHQKSASTIIGGLLEEAGVSHKFRHLQNKKPLLRDYCVQYRESTWAFVNRLLEDEGYSYFFEHEAGAHRMIMGNDAELHPKLERPLRFYRDDGRQPDEEVLTALELELCTCEDAAALDDYEPDKPDLELAFPSPPRQRDDDEAIEDCHVDSAPDPSLSKGLEHYDYPGGQRTPEEAKRRTKQRLEELRARHRTATGSSTCPALGAGVCFVPEAPPIKELAQSLLLLRVEHVVERGEVNLDTPMEQGRCAYHNRFVCIPRDVPFRPPRRTPRPLIPGLQSAVVVGCALAETLEKEKKNEIYTDEQGRVKLRFHWDRRRPGLRLQTCWVRVSQLWAGSGHGALFTPRVGDEVLVGFEEGDPDRPLVVGRVYNGHNRPPLNLPDQLSRSTIRGQSTPGAKGGNELTFEDREGDEELYLHAQRRLRAVARGQMSLTVGDKRVTRVKKNDETTVEEGHVKYHLLKGNADCTLTKGNAALTVKEGNLEIKVNGESRHYVDGKNRQVQVKNGDHITTVLDGKYRVVLPGDGQSLALICGKSRLVLEGNGEVRIEGRRGEVRLGLSSIEVKSYGSVPVKVSGGAVTVDGTSVKVEGSTVEMN